MSCDIFKTSSVTYGVVSALSGCQLRNKRRLNSRVESAAVARGMRPAYSRVT